MPGSDSPLATVLMRAAACSPPNDTAAVATGGATDADGDTYFAAAAAAIHRRRTVSAANDARGADSEAVYHHAEGSASAKYVSPVRPRVASCASRDATSGAAAASDEASVNRDAATSCGELRAAAQPSADEQTHAPTPGAAAEEAEEATMEQQRRSVGEAVVRASGQPSPPSASTPPRHGVLSWLRRGSRRGGKKGSPGVGFCAGAPEDSIRLPVVNEMPDDEPSSSITPPSYRASGAATEGGGEGASGGGEPEDAVVQQPQQEPALTQQVHKAAVPVVQQRSSVSRLRRWSRNSLSPASSPGS